MREQKANENEIVRWLQILAAVGIPLVLAYLALVGLVNPQFSEIREIVSSNRDTIAIVENNIERLEARTDLIAELLILAFTNENITEAELRNLLNAGEE